MESNSMMVEGRKIHSSSSDFLDNFYSKLPSSLVALHRPESCRSQRRLSGWYGEGRSASSNPLSSRPSSSLSRSASHNDVSRPSSSLLTSSSHDRTVTNTARPRSSLRRTMSNTHLINGFYDSKNNGDTNNYYLHGPYYENPDTSPYRADGPRIYKSDRHSFFNGKIFTVRDIPKPPPRRPTSAAEARSLFEPPKPAMTNVNHRFLDDRRSRNYNEDLSLSASINHVYGPGPAMAD